MGRFITGVIIIGVVGFLVWGAIRDVQEATPPDTQYIIRSDSRLENGAMNVLNTNPFSWPNPTFTINGRYKYQYSGHVKPSQKVQIPLSGFKDSDGAVFTGQFHKFDIRTATMAWNKKK